MGAVVTQEKAFRIAREAGVIPLEPYEHGRKLWRCECLLHGEVYPTYGGMQGGHGGCVHCGHLKQVASQRKGSAERTRANFLEVGLVMTGEYVDARSNIEAECLNCGSVVHKSANNVLKGQGCKICSYIRFIESRRGSSHPLWKGDDYRYINADGYVVVRLSPAHPYYGMGTGKVGHYHLYALEHRVVMAEHLGRVLLSSEEVHHKNGRRSDNRLINLELKSYAHGAGATIPDLLRDAREIIALYGDWDQDDKA